MASKYAQRNQPRREKWRNGRRQECWVCLSGGDPWRGLQIHEIERRSHAPQRWADYCNYFLTCPTCHEQHLSTMSHARQLAYKWIHDNPNFDLKRWLKLKDPDMEAPDRVTMGEILSHKDDICEQRGWPPLPIETIEGIIFESLRRNGPQTPKEISDWTGVYLYMVTECLAEYEGELFQRTRYARWKLA